MSVSIGRAVVRAAMLFFALGAAPAFAQYGFGPPSGPAVAPCQPFTGFPLGINLGTAPDGRDGEAARCGMSKVQNALNTLANMRTQPNGIATLDRNGLVPLTQIPATVSNTIAAPNNFTVGSLLTAGQLAVTGQVAVTYPGAESIANAFSGQFIFSGNNNNALIGQVLHNRAPGTLSFDTGSTGYGRLAAGSNGNQVFGLFGRADCNAPGTCTNEMNAFSLNADAPTTYPWNRGIGTTDNVPVALTVACGGTYKCASGIELAREGQTPGSFQFGIVARSDAAALWNVYFDATSTSSPLNGIYSATVGNGVNLYLKTTGTQVPKASVLAVAQADGSINASIKQDGSIYGTLLNLRQSTPANSGAICTTGDIAADTTSIYVCVSTSNWRRATLSAF
jgi:hypothetical protein